ncbi:glycosyltransferase [Methanococcoides sp. NM1]|uniref:glycosyltransferase n=1 Tax=Methanococcoides sp. NM1 TaxID=1201013 RepID=UPI00352BB16D
MVRSLLEFRGADLRDEMPIWMNACEVFALPSLGTGVVQIEAMACEKPAGLQLNNDGSEEMMI